MRQLKPHEGATHEFNDGAVKVTEFNFKGDAILNDAEIVLTSRYPTADYAINDISTALISIEEGEGSLTIKDAATVALFPGDRLLIKPGEPYYFTVMGRLAIRYIATPAWTSGQARTVK
ncbi:hypothetical protein D3C85_928120 [compost metagenome]